MFATGLVEFRITKSGLTASVEGITRRVCRIKEAEDRVCGHLPHGAQRLAHCREAGIIRLRAGNVVEADNRYVPRNMKTVLFQSRDRADG